MGLLADYVEKIVEIEGPIHIDEITARIRILWGLGRAGSRIRNAVQLAVERAVQRGTLIGGPFYTRPGSQLMTRDRSKVTSPTIRKPEMLPVAEIEHAMVEVVVENYGASRGDLILATSRAFGFASTSSQLRDVLSTAVDGLVCDGRLEVKGDLLVAKV